MTCYSAKHTDFTFTRCLVIRFSSIPGKAGKKSVCAGSDNHQVGLGVLSPLHRDL